MHLTLYEQGEIFRCAFIFGLFLGAFYDVFRLLRAFGLRSSGAVFVQDIIFMSCCAVMCFMFAQTTVHGHFRIFVEGAHFLGFLAYRCSIGIASGYIYKQFGKLFSLIISFFNKSIIYFARIVRKLVGKISTICGKMHKSICISKEK